MNEDNAHFTNREGNEISQPNLAKSVCLVSGTKYLTHLLEASRSTCLLSPQPSDGYKFLQTGTQGLQSGPKEMKHKTQTAVSFADATNLNHDKISHNPILHTE